MFMTDRREQLEKEIDIANTRLKNAPKDTPKEVLGVWRSIYDDLSAELNNLYDDLDDDTQ